MQEFRNEPLARQGFWRLGGPMERLCVVDTVAELRALGAVQHVLGNGSNLLIPDEGLPGTTVRLAGEFRALEVPKDDGERAAVAVGAGLLNAALLNRLQSLGFGGLGCLAGVPGSVGGAVAMNAGTALGEIGERLLAVEGADGERIDRRALAMAYREGGLPSGFIVTRAWFLVSRGERAAEQERVAAHLARRKATQPLDQPSCGSVFRNPPQDHAGRLIESVGLKGRRVGAAQISEKHANFIVNLGGASAMDAMRCIRLAWETVRAETGVELTPEVHVLGDWPAEIWPFPTSAPPAPVPPIG
jgi:UDP-N-acetylmuramate dehydrogenase